MTASVWGIVGRSGERDEDGHRSYEVKHVVLTTTTNDGPAVVMEASGLPAIGSYWDYGNDSDVWAWCLPTRKVAYHGPTENRPVISWVVTSYFSTKRDSRRCQTDSIEDPLLEPDRISGSFVKFQREVMKNSDGSWIKTSSHEPIRGPQVEFDKNRPTVTIEQNVADLELSGFAPMVDTLNDATLWGLSARKIKLSNASWRRELYGTCSFYFVRSFEFDVSFTGFDREVLDEGTKVLRGKWQEVGTGSPPAVQWVVDAGADASNPQDFIRYKDRNGENTRVPLNGSGAPLSDGASPVFIDVEHYGESNFLLLGIPSTLV